MSCPFNRVVAINSLQGLITRVCSLDHFDHMVKYGFELMERALTLAKKVVGYSHDMHATITRK